MNAPDFTIVEISSLAQMAKPEYNAIEPIERGADHVNKKSHIPVI